MDEIETEKKEKDDKKEGEKSAPWGRIFADAKGFHLVIAGGILAAALMGVGHPLLGYLIGDFAQVLANLRDDKTGASSELNNIFVIFIVIGIVVFIGGLFSLYLSALAGQNVTARLRKKCFKKIMENDIEFFDDPLNGPGSLCANLEIDCGLVNNMLSNILSSMCVNMSSVFLAIILAFASSWRMSLLTLVAAPVMVFVSWLDAKMWMTQYDKSARDEGGNIIQENITNIKTVRAMNTMENTLERFDSNMQQKYPVFKKILITSSIYGFGQGMVFYVMAYVFYMAGVIRDTYDESFDQIFKALFCLMWACFGAGFTATLAGDTVTANKAAVDIYEFCDRKDIILNSKNTVEVKPFSGNIEFKNVSFKYPTRKNYVFRNLSFKINPGQKVAFVGQSGKGKSTIIQ